MFKSFIKYLLITVSMATAVWVFLGIFTSVMDYSAESLILGLGIFLAAEIAVCTGYIVSKTDKK